MPYDTDSKIGTCPICRQSIYFFESHDIDNGIDYHSNCWIKHASIKKGKLEIKMKKGTLTIDGAKELEDLNRILFKSINNTNQEKQIKINNKLTCLQNRKGDFITRPGERQRFSRSNMDREYQKLCEARQERWKKEALDKCIEVKLLQPTKTNIEKALPIVADTKQISASVV